MTSTSTSASVRRVPRAGPGLVVLMLLLTLATTPSRADDEATLVADRPGFGESASAVLPRHVQAETGATWTLLGEDATSADGPELLLRMGLSRNVELRVVAPDRFRFRGGDASSGGWSDSSVGIKRHVAVGASDFAVRGTLNLPTGSAGLSSNRLDPEVAVAWSRGLPGRWSLGATVDTRWIRLRHQTLGSPSVSLGARLGPRLSTFLEYGATVGHGNFAVHRIDHGYTWAASRHTQLDASVGVGLSASAPDFFVEAGFCHLF
jgi:Putative MetA-pathway of phenol degradation